MRIIRPINEIYGGVTVREIKKSKNGSYPRNTQKTRTNAYVNFLHDRPGEQLNQADILIYFVTFVWFVDNSFL